MLFVVTPLDGLERLRVATSSGDLCALCRRYRISLFTVFGSVAGVSRSHAISTSGCSANTER